MDTNLTNVSFIIVDYNSMERTIQYIKSINLKIKDAHIHYIIVDNYASSMGLKLLNEEFGESHCITLNNYAVNLFNNQDLEVAYYFSKQNLGYAKGNNVGAIISKELYADNYLIISNNDLVAKEFISWKTIEDVFRKNPSVGVIGPKIVGKDGKPQSPNKEVGVFDATVKRYWIMKPFKWKGDLAYDATDKVCYRVSGCFMIIRSDYFLEVKGFDTNTFLFYEESILAEKLKKINVQMYFINSVELLHNHSETIKRNSRRKQVDYWMYESLIYYYNAYKDFPKWIQVLSKISFRIYRIRRIVRDLLKDLISR